MKYLAHIHVSRNTREIFFSGPEKLVGPMTKEESQKVIVAPFLNPQDVSKKDVKKSKEDIKDIVESTNSANYEENTLYIGGIALHLPALSAWFDNLNKFFDNEDNDAKNPEDEDKMSDSKDKEKTSEVISKKLEAGIDSGKKLTAAAALEALSPDIMINSTAHGLSRTLDDVNDRSPKSTSLVGIKPQSIDGANTLQKKLGVPLVITGGTEDGHSQGSYSHPNGDKFDFRAWDEGGAALEKLLAAETGRNDFPMGAKATITVDSHKMKFYRHGPKDHFDVTFYGKVA